MTKHYHELQNYLGELRQALQGQPAGLIQDALYDAESHLLEACHENEQISFSQLIADYGTADEIAAFYIRAEKDLQHLLHGKQQKSKFNGFFEPLGNLTDYKSLGYFFISAPLSILYFGWVMLIGMPVITLSVLLIGLPLLALFLKIQQQLALFEGSLISTLLSTRMPRRPAMASGENESLQSPLKRLLNFIKMPHGWKVTLYTVIQLPLSATYFCIACLLFLASLGLIASPIIDPIVHYFVPALSPDINWYWFPVTSVVGVIGITLSLHVSRALVKLHSGIAATLLIKHQES